MEESLTKEYPCDVCGCDDAADVPSILKYTGGNPLHVCKACGFVYIRRRRSYKAIADEWSDELFGSHFTALAPYMKARHVFLAESLKQHLGGLKGKRICDIGAGEGQFLDLVRGSDYGAEVFGVEPSRKNCARMGALRIPCAVGAIEDFAAAGAKSQGKFGIVTCMWTLENCERPRTMLDAAYDILNDDGYILLATSSRILVPFKKPLHYYLIPSKNPDTHCFRFSANTQRGILAQSGFEVTFVNRFIDHDILCMIAQKRPRGTAIPWERDNWSDVVDFFARWDVDTQRHFSGV